MTAFDAVAPGCEATLRMALERVPKGGRVLVLGSGGGMLTQALRVAGPSLALDEASGDAIDSVDSFDLIYCVQPSRLGNLVQVLSDLHDSLAAHGTLVVSDLVWQTAPTPDLMRAFAPQPGRERVRPIEGYEMQIDHVGFRIVERLDFGQAEWLAHLAHHPGAGLQREAIAADARGAARYSAWRLQKQ